MTLALATEQGVLTTDPIAESPLAIRGMTVSYGEKPAVFSVDMTVAEGAMTAIIGPKGRAARGRAPRQPQVRQEAGCSPPGYANEAVGE